ncbi:MAG: sortase [Lachnospiraceae bacterium]
MKNRLSIGSVCIAIGILLIGYASILFIQNINAEEHAQSYSADMVAQLYQEIQVVASEPVYRDEYMVYEEVVTIEEKEYLGILEIPSLGLTLPVQSSWSYSKLKETPCVYQTDPLIIAAHNYNAHFGEIGMLELGDQVKFVYATGEVRYFELVLVEVLHETSVEEMKSDDFDMTLFTCNLQDNSERIAVRFIEIYLD